MALMDQSAMLKLGSTHAMNLAVTGTDAKAYEIILDTKRRAPSTRDALDCPGQAVINISGFLRSHPQSIATIVPTMM